jgi:uncharacterized protein YjbJ (UPF0337 family)
LDSAQSFGALERSAKEIEMKPSTKDQMQGKFHEAKGAIKQKTGNATNDPNLAMRGRDEKNAGKVQNKVGQVERVFEK